MLSYHQCFAGEQCGCKAFISRKHLGFSIREICWFVNLCLMCSRPSSTFCPISLEVDTSTWQISVFYLYIFTFFYSNLFVAHCFVAAHNNWILHCGLHKVYPFCFRSLFLLEQMFVRIQPCFFTLCFKLCETQRVTIYEWVASRAWWTL